MSRDTDTCLMSEGSLITQAKNCTNIDSLAAQLLSSASSAGMQTPGNAQPCFFLRQARLKAERAEKLADKKAKRDEERRKKFAKKGGSLISADTQRVKMFG